MNNAYGSYEQGGNHYPQCGCLHTIVGAGLLPKQNVQRPAYPGAQCVAGTYQVNTCGRCTRRYQ
ncbi:hypothetical protein D3C87_2015090 [compost metagenome]